MPTLQHLTRNLILATASVLQCGPAALATAMAHSGGDVTPEELARSVHRPAHHDTAGVASGASIRSSP